jgi:hypothetical protein
MDVPAICRSCGAVFPSGIVVKNARNITMAGNTAGPCPACAGMGEIPDGVYDFVGDTIRVVATSGYSRTQLERLADLIAQARVARASPIEVVEQLEREAPELSEVAKRLLVPRTPADLVAWLTLILMAIQMLLSIPGREGLSEADINRLTDRAVERALQQPAPPAGDQPAASPAAKKPPTPPRRQRGAKGKRKKQRG